MKKEHIIIVILVAIIAILLALFVLTNVPLFDEEVTFDGMKMTAPAGSTYINSTDGMEFYDFDGKYIFGISKNGLSVEDFDTTYDALSSGKLSSNDIMSMASQDNSNITFTECVLGTYNGYNTIEMHAEGFIKNETGKITVIQFKANNNVYTISYLPTNENSMKIHNSLEFIQ